MVSTMTALKIFSTIRVFFLKNREVISSDLRLIEESLIKDCKYLLRHVGDVWV